MDLYVLFYMCLRPVISFLFPFVSVCFVGGFAYLSSQQLSMNLSSNHLLFKSCGTFSPEDKVVHFIVWIFLGTYYLNERDTINQNVYGNT
jgi:hypothetical protein